MISIRLELFSKPLKVHLKSKTFMQLCFPRTVIRRNYVTESEEGRKIGKMNIEHKIHSDVFQRKKFCVDKKVVSILTKIFEADEGKFLNLYLHPNHIKERSETQLEQTALYLRELNFTAEHIVSSPWILLLIKENIEKKTPLLTKTFLFENIADGLGFSIFRPELIMLYNKKFEEEKKTFDSYRNRIYYIGRKLNIPVNILTLKIVPAWEVLHVSKYKIDRVIELLLEFNYKPDAVLSDIRVFHSNYDTAKERLLKLQNLDCHQPKLWVWRTNKFNFIRTYQRTTKYGQPLEDDREMLKEELKLNEEDYLHFISKGSLSTIRERVLLYRIKKYKEVGLSNDLLVKYPNFLTRREDLVLKRLEVLKKKRLLRYIKGGTSSLVLPDDQFNDYVDMLQKSKRYIRYI